MDSAFSHYDLLGVRADASTSEIRDAYRCAMLQYHPDVNPAPNAQSLATMLNRAYAVLSDATLRRQYDESIGIQPTSHNNRTQASSNAQTASPQTSSATADPFSGLIGWFASRALKAAVYLVGGMIVIAIAIHFLPFIIAAIVLFAIIRTIFR